MPDGPFRGVPGDGLRTRPRSPHPAPPMDRLRTAPLMSRMQDNNHRNIGMSSDHSVISAKSTPAVRSSAFGRDPRKRYLGSEV